MGRLARVFTKLLPLHERVAAWGRMHIHGKANLKETELKESKQCWWKETLGSSPAQPSLEQDEPRTRSE